MVSLRQLRYLRALAREAHFGRAARACSVSQPALSMQIKELEQELNLRLVERGAREVRLTAEGMEIARRAERILLEVQDLHDFASQRRGHLGPSLRLGVIPTVGPYLLPVVLPELQGAYPNLDLRLRETRTGDLVDELLAGELDAALLAVPVSHAQVETMALFEDRFLLVLPPQVAPPQRARIADLRPESLLLLEEGHCLREQALALCGSVQPEAMRRFGATSLATILQLVAGGYGVTLLPEMALAAEIRPQAGLQVVPFAAPEPARCIGLAWRASSPRADQLRRLGKLIASVWRTARDAAALSGGPESP